jgi:leucyl-tRNA synthetase
MNSYNSNKIEKKWQKIWEKEGIYKVKDKVKGKKNFYHLVMFPYPSGDLHIGHWYNFAPADIFSRFKKMSGFNVLSPIGFDAFGLPAENAAIKRGIHPKDWTYKNIKTMSSQLKSMGNMYDWSRQVITADPEYYKWTQWMFLQLYKNGLAYKKKAPANWCPKCHTVLANEQVVDGRCERCDTQVIKRDIEQWLFKITDYAEDLLKDLDKLDWPEKTKIMQRNWIGKSEGAIIRFDVKCQMSNVKCEPIEVFTTRVDTIFGCTYLVVAPEHEMIRQLAERIKNYDEVKKYIEQANNKSDLQRTDLAKDKSGVELKGIKAINPFNNEEIPVFVADYVLGHYGTGAVMAVPAHDERDWEFAKKYNLPIRETIVPQDMEIIGSGALIQNTEGKFIFQKRDHNTDRNPGMITLFGGGRNKGESFEDCLKREMTEEIYLNIDIDKVFTVGKIESHNFPGKFINIFYIPNVLSKKLKVNEGEGIIELSLAEALESNKITEYTKKTIRYFQSKNNFSFTEDGVLVNSGEFSGLISEKARENMVKWSEEKNLGKKKVNYKLRDWLVSRQRYWGTPIPIVYCEKCEEVAVPEKDLPVKLPNVKKYLPTEEGKSPLAHSEKFLKTKCPKCGGKATRETDTIDTFVCSSWYYLRYVDNKNFKKFADVQKLKNWLPVDMYIGGAEHTVLHLLYSRFFTKALKDFGYLNFNEPFSALRHQGIILGPDGQKMSKSRGNVVDPDDLVKKFGADAVRMHLAFMGPYDQGGPWNPGGILGIKRFLDRVWRLFIIKRNLPIVRNVSEAAKAWSLSEVRSLGAESQAAASRWSEPTAVPSDRQIERLLHQTIKKVTEDIENFRFNTAISSLMILFNEMEKQSQLSIVNCQLFLKLLAPFAPYLSEEIWRNILKNKKSIYLESWPKYNSKLIIEKQFELIIQINGKIRDKILMEIGISQKEAENLALNQEKIKNAIGGNKIRKIIFVPNKLINIVI